MAKITLIKSIVAPQWLQGWFTGLHELHLFQPVFQTFNFFEWITNFVYANSFGWPYNTDSRAIHRLGASYKCKCSARLTKWWRIIELPDGAPALQSLHPLLSKNDPSSVPPERNVSLAEKIFCKLRCGGHHSIYIVPSPISMPSVWLVDFHPTTLNYSSQQ